MQTQNIKTELTINETKVVIGHQFLEDIARNIPDVKENKAVFGVLAQSENPSVRETISRNDNLSKKIIHLLLNDENQEVVDNILSHNEHGKQISEETLFSLIASNNTKYLKTIAQNIDNYVLCDTCKIATILSEHENTSVRYSLVHWRSNDAVTSKILKKLSEDEDFDVAKQAKEALDWR